MDDAIGMEKRGGQSDIMTDIYLDMISNRLIHRLKEMGQALVHQLHQKHWQTTIRVSVHAQILDDIGVPYRIQKLTFLLKPPDGQPVLMSLRHALHWLVGLLD